MRLANPIVVKAVILNPGDPLPQGTFVTAWKLREDIYGPKAINLLYIPTSTESPTRADQETLPRCDLYRGYDKEPLYRVGPAMHPDGQESYQGLMQRLEETGDDEGDGSLMGSH